MALPPHKLAGCLFIADCIKSRSTTLGWAPTVQRSYCVSCKPNTSTEVTHTQTHGDLPLLCSCFMKENRLIKKVAQNSLRIAAHAHRHFTHLRQGHPSHKAAARLVLQVPTSGLHKYCMCLLAGDCIMWLLLICGV